MSDIDAIFRDLDRSIAKATRAAMEETFRYWWQNMAPDHFRRIAFSRYPNEFSASAKRDAAAWLRRNRRFIKSGLKDPAANPLRESGRLERAFLSGPVTFSGGNLRLTARWPGLPAYASYTNKRNGFRPAEAILAMNEADLATIERLFKEWLSRNLTTGQIADKTYGLGTLTGD